MKTNIKEKKQDEKYKFPCLLISKKDNKVLYATDIEKSNLIGMLLIPGKSGYPEGHYSMWGKEEFVLFEGIIELSND